MFIGTTYCNGGWISVIKYYLEIYNRLIMINYPSIITILIIFAILAHLIIRGEDSGESE